MSERRSKMSIKIYNGYILDQNYSLRELNDLFVDLRKKMQETANKSYLELIMDFCVYVQDMIAIFGKEKAEQMLQREERFFKGSNFIDCWNCVEERVIEASKSDKRNFRYDFQSEVQILPIENKILLMYFGNDKDELLQVFENEPYISEYHYQNQTDKPDSISEEEWEERRRDWTDALPSWIPSDTGFTIQLVNINKFPFPSQNGLSKIFNPASFGVNGRAYAIAEWLMPVYKSLSEVDLDAYKKEKLEKAEEIKEKLCKLDSMEALWSYIQLG